MTGDDRRNTYMYDKGCAERVVRFLTTRIRFVKGPLYGQPLQLLDYQRDFTMRLFGEKYPDGRRRYNHAFMWVPRKNSKTTYCSGLALYMLGADGEPGARVAGVAGVKQQAALLLEDSKQMVKLDPVLAGAYLIRQYDIRHLKTNSSMRVYAPDPDRAQGLDLSCVILDEIHTYKSNKVYNAFDSGMVARDQPLLVGISTAGVKGTWPHEFYRACKKIQTGELDMSNWLVSIHEAEQGSDPFDMEAVKNANPGWGVTVKENYVKELMRDAENRPEALNEFRRFHRNEWTGSYISFIPTTIVEDAAVEPQGWEELKDTPCYVGVDMSTVNDLTAISFLFDMGDGHFYWKILQFSPVAMILYRQRNPTTPYETWARKGEITGVEGRTGKTIDYGEVLQDLLEVVQQLTVKALGYDVYNATLMMHELEDNYKTTYYVVPQTMLGLGEATKSIQRVFLENRITHDGYESVMWQGENIQVFMDNNGNIRFSKGESYDKIDAWSSLACAFAAYNEKTKSKKRPPGIFIAGAPRK